MIALPTERTRPPLDVGALTILLYGAPKIGKSTFCARFPRGLFLATEPGLAHLDTYSIPCDSWEQACAAVDAVAADPSRFSPIIIDTADRMWDHACADVAKKAGVETVSEIGYGRGLDRAEALFKGLIMRLASLRRGLVLTSHAAAAAIQPPGGEKVNKWQPTLHPRALAVCAPLVDIVLYAQAEPTVDRRTGAHIDARIAHAGPAPHWIAGDRTGRLPAQFPFSWKIFNGFFTDAGKAPEAINNPAKEETNA